MASPIARASSLYACTRGQSVNPAIAHISSPRRKRPWIETDPHKAAQHIAAEYQESRLGRVDQKILFCGYSIFVTYKACKNLAHETLTKRHIEIRYVPTTKAAEEQFKTLIALLKKFFCQVNLFIPPLSEAAHPYALGKKEDASTPRVPSPLRKESTSL